MRKSLIGEDGRLVGGGGGGGEWGGCEPTIEVAVKMQKKKIQGVGVGWGGSNRVDVNWLCENAKKWGKGWCGD